ncbi:coiled-coil domain-containing protein R3HCC1L-like [Glandiceps talaboti]
MFDDSGECLNEDLKKELSKQVKKKKKEKAIVVQKAEYDYYNYQPKDNFDYSAFSHVIEVYDFPPELKTEDLLMAFKQFQTQGFDIKWVDDTHALAVFSGSICANDALDTKHPLLKTRPLMMATRESKMKARKSVEFLQPYRARPETTAMTARRLVIGALGISGISAPRAKRDEERRKLKEAKDKKREEKKQKHDMWEGNI